MPLDDIEEMSKITSLIPSLRKYNITDAEGDAEQGVFESNCGARSLAWLDVFYRDGVRVALTI